MYYREVNCCFPSTQKEEEGGWREDGCREDTREEDLKEDGPTALPSLPAFSGEDMVPALPSP